MNKRIITDRNLIPSAERIVIKVGTSTVTHDNGRINFRNIERIAWSISGLMNQGKEVVLVTSGAIGVGVGCLNLEEKPKEMGDKQAIAAIGQCELMNVYSRCFAEYSYVVGQVLLTKDDLDDPRTRENISNTFSALIRRKIVPIVNENDTVSTQEILHNGTFGDNDSLSAHVAVLVDADILLILSDVDGLYDSNPRENQSARRISLVEEISQEMRDGAGGSGSKRGTGGMQTKVAAMSLVSSSGIAGLIALGSDYHVIDMIMDGQDCGTFFRPQKST